MDAETRAWTRWADGRPEDHTVPYRWRVSERPILGLAMRPEWTGKMQFVGMGYADNECWPPFSKWDGYTRSVDRTTEWRPALPEETDTVWHGLDLLPSPFTGRPPKVQTSGRYIGAPPYYLEWIGIESFMVRSLGWRDAAKMRDAWNTRSAPVDSASYAAGFEAAKEMAADAVEEAMDMIPTQGGHAAMAAAVTAIRSLHPQEPSDAQP